MARLDWPEIWRQYEAWRLRRIVGTGGWSCPANLWPLEEGTIQRLVEAQIGKKQRKERK